MRPHGVIPDKAGIQDLNLSGYRIKPSMTFQSRRLTRIPVISYGQLQVQTEQRRKRS
jgi:hypothetical protein